MSVHIFEAVGFAVRRRHQFDDPFARMRGEARCLLEYVPAPVIGVDRVGEIDENPLDPEMVHQSHHILDAYEWNIGERGGGRRHVYPLFGVSRGLNRSAEIGRAWCRERVCKYV